MMLESSFDDEYKRRKSNTDKTKSSKTSKHSTNPTEESKLSSEKSSSKPPLSQESESASNPLDETIEELPFKRYHGFAFANPRSGDGLAGRFLNDYPPKNIK
jgi:hypothetical protein